MTIVKQHGFSAIRRRKYVSDYDWLGNNANIIGTANRYTSAFFYQSLNAEVNIQYNCLQNECASPPEEPFEVALWQYAVTTLAVVLGKTLSEHHEGISGRFMRKHRSNGSYMHYVGDGAPPASFETLSRDLRIL